MGAAVSECVGLRKKPLFIDPIRIVKDEEAVSRKKQPLTVSKVSGTIALGKPPKTPMELLFPQANDSTSRTDNNHNSMSEREPPKKREGLEDITSLIEHSQNIQEEHLLIKDKSLVKEKSQCPLNRPPELKFISKIDAVGWSPIKDEYEMK